MLTAVIEANGNPYMYFSIFSPVYVGFILLFLSGVPTLEEPWDKKYGKDPAYRAYKRSVPPLVLFLLPVPAHLPARCPLSKPSRCRFRPCKFRSWAPLTFRSRRPRRP